DGTSVESTRGELLTGSVGAATSGESIAASADAQGTSVAPHVPRSRRRWLLAAGGTLAAGVLIAVVAAWLKTPADLTLETLADTWHEHLGNPWQAIARAPKDCPVPAAILVSPAAWQTIGRFPAPRVIAYELVHANGRKAILYVARMTRGGLP